MKKLYRCIVSIEFDMVVAADDIKEAHKVVDMYANDELDNRNKKFSVMDLREIRNATDVPGEWSLDAIPYCGYDHEDDYTIEHYLDVQAEAEKEAAMKTNVDKRQISLFDRLE